MFFWFSKRSKALIGKRRQSSSSIASTELRQTPTRAMTLVDVGRAILRIKASDPEITDVELALRFDKPLDYLYTAIEAARRSYVSTSPPPEAASRQDKP